MAKRNVVDGLSAVNQNLEICFVSSEQLSDCLSMGYQHLMVKIPTISDIPKLTKQERLCFRLLLKGLVTKSIAYHLSISDSRARALLLSLREKFTCTNNSELVAKAYAMGIHTFI